MLLETIKAPISVVMIFFIMYLHDRNLIFFCATMSILVVILNPSTRRDFGRYWLVLSTSMCCGSDESPGHIMIQCPFAACVWSRILDWCSVSLWG